MITYSELMEYDSYEERLNTLMLNDYNYKSPRGISMPFFKSAKWRRLREYVIKRDFGFDLGIFGVKIDGKVIVHHIDPVGVEDIQSMSSKLTTPENLITVSIDTHNIIHYGNPVEPIEERKPGDTILR